MAARAASVRVSGLKETLRALNKVNKEARGRMLDEIRQAAEPVAAEARSRLSPYAGLSTSTIGPKTSAKGVFVTQRKRKVTGLRPDFGGLQMTEGLLPALMSNQDEIVREVEDALGRLISSANLRKSGF